MRMFFFILIVMQAALTGAVFAQSAPAAYTPPDMFGDPDAQVSVEDAAIPPLPAPVPPSAPIIVKAPPPAPPPVERPATTPLSDALRGVDNKAPPPPLPDLSDNVGTKPGIIAKPDMTPMALDGKPPETKDKNTPAPAHKPVPKVEPKPPEPKPEPKPEQKVEEKPAPKLDIKPEPKPPEPEPVKPAPPPVEKAAAVPVTPVEKSPAPAPSEPLPIVPPTPPSAPPAPIAPTVSQIMAPPPVPIVAPDVAPPRVDTSKSPDLAAQLIFAPGAADMVPNQKTVLAQDIIAPLQEDTNTRLQIVAYATAVDEGMSSARRISLGRALAIRDHLKEVGIAPERIDVRAMGSETNASPVDRVDLLLIPAR